VAGRAANSFHQRADDVTVASDGQNRVELAVKPHCGREAFVAEQEANPFEIRRVFIEIELCREMPELVQCHRDTDLLGDEVAELGAEASRIASLAILAGQQPGRRARKHPGPIMLDVMIEETRQPRRELGGDRVLVLRLLR
jgi:hypothetical protein